MLRYLFLCTFLLSACVSAQTSSEQEILNRLPQPPLNGQNQAEAKPTDEKLQQIPDKGSAPVALFSNDERPFLGRFSGTTTVRIEEQCLLFKDDKLPNQVCLAIPKGLDLQQGTFQAQTDLRSYSGLEGKDEHLYLATKDGKELSFGYHFEVTDKPQEIKFPNLPRVRQKEVRNNQQENYQAVPVIITTDEGEEELKLGRVQSIRLKGALYRVFLHTSTRQADAGSCGDGGYILRLMYVKDSRA